MWLVLSFPAGRIHATPWGRHVNEGAIEYPPSPWRLLRSLIATGFAKLGWSEVPAGATRVFEKLAATPPRYRIATELPTAHTRHFMPDYRDGRDKVFDAFAVVPRDAPVIAVQWDVELAHDERAVVEQLATYLGYLGRAEAWADGAIVDEPPAHLVECKRVDLPPGPDWEEVRLLAPLPADALAQWLAAASRDVDGKARPRLPRTVVEVLCADTAILQKDGWSQPPGTRWLTYWRPSDTLVARPEPVLAPVGFPGGPPTSVLMAVSSDTSRGERYPSMTTALWRGELIHKALVNRAAKLSQLGDVPSSITGKDVAGAPMAGHRHVHILPLDLRERGPAVLDGRIDHFLLHAPGGLDEAALRAVRRVRRTYAADMPDLYLTVVGEGVADDFADRVPACGAHRTWTSTTPFVPPRHLKDRGRDTLEGQVGRECQARGWPEPRFVGVQIEGGGVVPASEFASLFAPLRSDDRRVDVRLEPRWRHFKRDRRSSGRAPPQSLAVGLRLEFSEPVRGPLAIGYGSHLGLGMFEPATGGQPR